jgi:hypothetical protein
VPSGLVHIEHLFGGGWAPDYGSSCSVSVDQSGRCEIPWMAEVENAEFEVDGSIHKVGGVTNLTSSALESATTHVRGIYDFWKQGTAGSPVQKRFVHVGTKVKMDDADAVFADVYTGLDQGSIPHYSTFEGQIIIAQSGNDMPMYSDGVTHSTFASPTPNFAFSESHKLRMWAAGSDAAPSTLFYSAQEDPTDWTGAGSGDIAISPGDGDKITAIASHRNELFVFKGPYHGSIHRISGSAPEGDDAFARNDFVPYGLGAVGQRSIFRFGNDLGFMWSDGSVHSLNTTERFGDFLEASLSRPINRWLREHVGARYLDAAQAVTLDTRGVVRIAVPIDSSTYNNVVLSMDFRFDPPRWSKLSFFPGGCVCIASIFNPAGGRKSVMASGSTSGHVYLWDRNLRVASTFGYVCTAATPFLSYVKSPQTSTIYFGGVKLTPDSATNIDFEWVRDGKASQSVEFLQWTGDVLGTATAGATNFTLGSSILMGDRSISHSVDLTEGGEFKEIQYIARADAAYEDLLLKSFTSSIKPGGPSMEKAT